MTGVSKVRYEIAGVLVEFIGDNDFLKTRCSAFEDKCKIITEASPDLTVTAEMTDTIHVPDGELILDEQSRWYRKKDADKGLYISMSCRKDAEVDTILETDPEWKNVNIKYMKHDLNYPINESVTVNWNQYHIFQLTGIAFRNRTLSMDSITIHSSSFAFDGKGIIVSAPSGTGKSTHVRLWKEKYAERVLRINDDRPLIRFLEGVPMLCGTPWSGSTDIYMDTKVPLAGIVMLERAPRNSIERLDTCRALQMLMPRCFLPYFDERLMNAAMKVVEKLVVAVPVYLLRCRPDYEAVELVHRCVS